MDNALDVAREAWDKWVAGDLDGFLALWHADGVWTQSGRSRVAGELHGPGEMAEMARIAFEVSGGTLKATPLELVASGSDSVLGYFRIEAQRPGASIDQVGLQRFVIRDGKIASLHNVYADDYANDEFYKE